MTGDEASDDSRSLNSISLVEMVPIKWRWFTDVGLIITIKMVLVNANPWWVGGNT